jgi:acetyl esterase/lipase
MMKRIVLLAGTAALLTTSLAVAAPGDRWRERMAERRGAGAAPAPATPAAQVIAYGRDAKQSLNFWPAQGARGPTPLIVFVHGGGWSRGSKDNATGASKVAHYPQAGYAFASIDYRLVPGATVEQQAEDVAAAVKALVDRAGTLGLDRRRIVLMGHSAGAHLVALVGTDPQYLRGAGLAPADIAGVVALDGAGYDVAAQMGKGGQRLQQTYTQAFGSDPLRQAALSPMSHVAAPNASRFLILYVDRAASARQSPALGAALRREGTSAQVESVEGRGMIGHLEINRRLGDADYPATGIVDRWLAEVFVR